MIDIEFFRHVSNGSKHCSPELLMAISKVESSLDPWAVRFEPNWKYPYKIDEFAKELGITRDTEKTLQSMSWGLMQIMGTVARELGFDRSLVELTNPTLNLTYAIKKIETLFERYKDFENVISSYNQGYPKRKNDGSFVNQIYVDKVLKEFNLLK